MTGDTQKSLVVIITGSRAAPATRAISHLLTSMGAEVTVTDASTSQAHVENHSYEMPLIGVSSAVVFVPHD